MIDDIFDFIVDKLEEYSDKFGISYKEINVYGFFAWLAATGYLIYDSRSIRKAARYVLKMLF